MPLPDRLVNALIIALLRFGIPNTFDVDIDKRRPSSSESIVVAFRDTGLLDEIHGVRFGGR